jgi:hypothetical protein
MGTQIVDFSVSMTVAPSLYGPEYGTLVIGVQGLKVAIRLFYACTSEGRVDLPWLAPLVGRPWLDYPYRPELAGGINMMWLEPL